jgi:uncharacterized repeat protein (TIGR01451 family)
MMRMFAAALALGLPTLASAAAPAVSLSNDVFTERTVTRAGRSETVLTPPALAMPGDTLLFATRYRNARAATVRNVVVTNAVPAGLTLSDHATPGALVSLDGGRRFVPLASISGREGITHVRWTLPAVAPGSEGMLQFRAVVR